MTMARPHRTHEVLNQPPPLAGYNVFGQDRGLRDALDSQGAPWAAQGLEELGALAGSAQANEWGAAANQNPPVLDAFDRYGNRVDEIRFHPAWHELMRVAISRRLHSLPYVSDRQGASVARAASFFVWSQAEAGHGCPIAMTHAGISALRAAPEVAAEWEPKLTSATYDPRYLPAEAKSGAICGMAMTEKQGGSDVRAGTSTAEAAGAQGEFLITGHKWFCSAPMSDLLLVLAQAKAGLTCFAVPRFTPDGAKNAVHIQRLKDKLGNRSNASGEIEMDGAWGRLVGEEGRGTKTIIDMVNRTRLDSAVGSAAGMRLCAAQVAHHAAHRAAFGKLLADQPLMRNVLADMAVESEAATLTVLRLARAFEEAPVGSAGVTRGGSAPGSGGGAEAAFARLATPVVKYWVTKRWPALAAEAIESLGGNGYVETSELARAFRESPVNSIWEGSGNVVCLDVARALRRDPGSAEAFVAELELASGRDERLDELVAELSKELASPPPEDGLRRLVGRMAVALQASLLVRHSPGYVADAYLSSRVSSRFGQPAAEYGTLPPGVDFARIIERATPRLA
ncbi:MAG: acyl-CoA dehydrogenase family protein [Acidimicrobiales bacterium]